MLHSFRRKYRGGKRPRRTHSIHVVACRSNRLQPGSATSANCWPDQDEDRVAFRVRQPVALTWENEVATLESVASCADSSSELRPPSSQPLPAGISQGDKSVSICRLFFTRPAQKPVSAIMLASHSLGAIWGSMVPGFHAAAIPAREAYPAARFYRRSMESRSWQ